MGRLTDLFTSRSVPALVERARRKMAAGKLADAARVLERGLELYPGSGSLLELQISVRRAQAHATIRKLEVRIEERSDPHAYEELIDLYLRLELPEQALRHASAYVGGYPDRDAPHLILGSMHLESYFGELKARHGHQAHDHLLRAAGLNALAVQPRMLLAELYFCVGADQSLALMIQAITRLAPASDQLQAAAEIVRHLAGEGKEDHLDGIFERVECNGSLMRAPEDWPLSKRTRGETRMHEQHTDDALMELVATGVVDELVVMRRDGSIMSHATPTGLRGLDAAGPEDSVPQGLESVVRTVASKVLPQATEFDLGRFQRCTIQGSFGNIVIGRIHQQLAGGRGQASIEPHRMWDRICLHLEGKAGGGGR